MAAPLQKSFLSRFSYCLRCNLRCQGLITKKYTTVIKLNPPIIKSPLACLPFYQYRLQKHSTITQRCWKCHTELDPEKDQYFCECGLIQPPVKERTLFQVVNIKEDFDLDVKQLTRNFYMLQNNLHPDKFAQKSEEEKAYSAEQSSILNKAYFTLLRPLTRGLYMLEQRGHSITEGDITVDNSFLMNIMEVNEQLLEAESLTQIKQIKEDNLNKLNQHIHELSKAFKEDDIEHAKQLLAKLKYYANIDDKVKEHELMHTDS